MILEVLAKVEGQFLVESNMKEVINHPYIIKLFFWKERNATYLSVKKRMSDFLSFLPKMAMGNNCPELIFPSNDFFLDITEIMQHIESFGSLEKNISKICWTTPTIRWIREIDSDPISPVEQYEYNSNYNIPEKRLSGDWLKETVLYKNMMGDLYMPFSFFREGANLYHEYRYQAAFCSFYMMLEYLYSTGSYGIKNDAYKNNKILNIGLINSLEMIKVNQKHYKWIEGELSRRCKKYDEEGLLFLLNRFRDELSHAVNRNRNRNPFNENAFQSIAFICMNVCLCVSIKERLLPFVSGAGKDAFTNK